MLAGAAETMMMARDRRFTRHLATGASLQRNAAHLPRGLFARLDQHVDDASFSYAIDAAPMVPPDILLPASQRNAVNTPRQRSGRSRMPR